MPIERTFAIHASARAIFDALERDLVSARAHEGGTWAPLRRDPPRALDLRVTIGGSPCMLEYRIEEVRDGCEVTARLIPYGMRHTFFRIITFGLHTHGYEAALTQSLANLKEAVEGDTGRFPDEGSLIITPADE